MKESGLSSRIPRLQHRISQESLTSETNNLSPRTIPHISLDANDDENEEDGEYIYIYIYIFFIHF